MDTAFSERLGPDIAQFEVNAALWRLEIDRHVRQLLEDAAMDGAAEQQLAAARVALEGVGYEISRFRDFVDRHSGFPLDMLVRLAEVATALETARRNLKRALDLKHEDATVSDFAWASPASAEAD